MTACTFPSCSYDPVSLAPYTLAVSSEADIRGEPILLARLEIV